MKTFQNLSNGLVRVTVSDTNAVFLASELHDAYRSLLETPDQTLIGYDTINSLRLSAFEDVVELELDGTIATVGWGQLGEEMERLPRSA